MSRKVEAIRLGRLAESQTLAMTRLARELKAQGKDVINLSIGEPDFNTPDFIKEAAKKAIDDNYSHYTPVPGLPELRSAISTKFKRDNGLNYAPEQIVVSTGAKHSIANVALSILNEGDEVLVPAPYWVSYLEIIKLAEATPIIIPTDIENDFKVTVEQIKSHITPKTRMIIYSSPCNPTGSLYSKDELKEIADLLSNYPDIIVVSDEIYEHINFVGQHESIAQFENIYEQTVTINGVSKGYAMTGWRIGYIGAPKWIADACTKIQGQFTSGTSAISQKAAEAAILAEPSVTNEMKKAFLERRNLVLELLGKIEGFKLNQPEGAFYVFPEISSFFGKTYNGTTINNSQDLCMFLLNEANVALVSGEAFGAEGYIRISYATSNDILIESIKRIEKAVALLK